MKTKLLIAGLPNTGKTTLLQSLNNVLVFARDGKKYPFPQPHVNVESFTYVSELLEVIEEKIHTFKEKMGKYPDTVVIDSMSKILLDIESTTCARVKSFPYGVVNGEISALMAFIETNLTDNFNIILVSHAIFDPDTENYNLVNPGGSWGKKGGILSEVDQSIFIEIIGKKRVIHLRNANMTARTTIEELPDKVNEKDFCLQEHLDLLQKHQSVASDFSL